MLKTGTHHYPLYKKQTKKVAATTEVAATFFVCIDLLYKPPFFNLEPFQFAHISNPICQRGDPLEQGQPVFSYGWIFIHHQHIFKESIDSWYHGQESVQVIIR